jgi:ANTAR domain-containing protein
MIADDPWDAAAAVGQIENEEPDDVLSQLREENEQLRGALASRVAIEQAKGVLAERLEVSVEEAFAVLRYSARSERMQIHDLAAQVVPSAAMPPAIVRGLAREARWRALAIRERTEASRDRSARLHAAVEEQAERIARARRRGKPVVES